jgi:hypothetical protein
MCDVTTKLEGQRRTLVKGLKNVIVALKLERELRLVNVGTGIRDHGDIFGRGPGLEGGFMSNP